MILILSFFMLNLFLAVIMETFSDMADRQKELEKQREEEKAMRVRAFQEAKSRSLLSQPTTIQKMITVAQKKMELTH